ncbi:VOC family protein [Solwaraspora sp. WMMA2080]|uniref:VOC family protein n=1 Tax=unclassified Solwaraspora TaxID=2627926 RepID=UPI00248AF842|nr:MULTISPECIES: VOC family protein [unclassified Solwaraspora]WBB96118.1 VOC family protein [Solwaraspora sp. WMMA2059]WBC19977.1 VOC family protein [Solwaraspora sp. WMMA2080]
MSPRVTGIGGYFFRSRDPQALARWYSDNLGIDPCPGGDQVWTQAAGPTVWAPFPEDTDYFGARDQASMVNFRVEDLDRMLDQLRASGTTIVGDVHTEPIGRFAWALDPEGNRFELWEPA